MALAPVRPGIRSGFALLLWLCAVSPLALLALDAHSPFSAELAAGIAGQGIEIGSMWLIFGSVVALLAYPPFIPSARLWFRNLKTRMSIDQGQAISARGRLQHLETADDHVLIARTAIDMGNPTGALPHLLRAVEIETNHLNAHSLLGHVYRRLGVLQKAVEELLWVVRREPDYNFGAAALELAICLERVGQDQKALDALQLHAEAAGENRRALLLKARILRSLKDLAGAKATLRLAAREPEPGQFFSLEEAQARARARFALWRGGRA